MLVGCLFVCLVLSSLGCSKRASEASEHAVASEASYAVASEASNGGWWEEGGPPSAAFGLNML